MSARVCYIRRSDRGAALRGARLISQTTDESWPESGDASGSLPDYAAAAAWVRARLDATRSASSIAMLCLDVDGGACAWLSSPSADPAVVASAARFGGDSGRAAGGAFEFYAPGDLDSTIQGLGDAPDPSGNEPRAARLPVVALTDVPARLMVDALDRERVPVESVGTLWHALAAAWDPGAVQTPDGPVSDVVTAVLMADPAGRLVWCWSRSGKLLAGGSMRVRIARLETAGAPADSAEEELRLGADEAARLATEWLSWAAQLGRAPSRVVCALTPGEGAAGFGQALAAAWPGAAVDAGVYDDPVEATLRRLADRLESTPKRALAGPDAAHALVALSNRPGHAHRRMFQWRALAMLGVAALLGVASWRLYASAGAAGEATREWTAQWRKVVGDAYPDALRERPGKSALSILDDEIKTRRRNLLPPERSDQAMPVLQELETVTMVIGTGEFALESIDLRSTGAAPRVVVIAKDLRDAEALEEAFNRVAGSYITSWTGKYTSRTEGTETRIRAEYSGEWNHAMIKAAGGAP